MKLNLNGAILDAAAAEISPDNRGLQFGDSVFETMRYSGGKIFFWEDHYFRLMAAMRVLRMEIPMDFSMEQLEAEIIKTLEASEAPNKTCRIRLTIWRKWGGKYTPGSREIEFMIQIEELATPFYTVSEDSYEIELFKDHYVLSGLLSTLKTNNKLVSVLGSIYAEENDYQNCLILNENKMVVEALNGNIFLVNGYKIKTPPLSDGCLKGVLRKQIIDIIGKLPDYVLEEETVSPFELQKADEIFITNVIGGIQPVTKYRKKTYDNKVAKELLAKLNVKARLE